MFDRFEELASVYRERVMMPDWKGCHDFEENMWGSVRLFLRGYAFERQGSSPDYRFAAAEAIDNVRAQAMSEKSAGKVWEKFKAMLAGKGVNYANNPVCPKGSRYEVKYKKVKQSRTVKKKSAIELALEVKTPLVAWARDEIRNNRVAEAHKKLKEVNGIADKIASFFLRDVAVYYGLAPTQRRELLQPIDVWIRFVAQSCSQDKEMNDPACAAFIVKNAQNPERANQGMWYFCTAVAHSSQYLVKKSLEEPTRLEELIKHHVADLLSGAEAAQKLIRNGLDDGGQK